MKATLRHADLDRGHVKFLVYTKRVWLTMIRTEAKITVSLLFRVRAFFDYHKRCNVHRSEQKNAVVAIRLHREKTKLAARFCGTRRFDFETTDLILKKIPDRRNDGDLCRIAWNNYGHHHDGEGDNESRCEEGKLQRNDCERRRRDADATRRDTRWRDSAPNWKS